MPSSRLDSFYRRLLITKFFEKGWGKPENLQRLFEFRKIISNREKCFKLVPPDYPIEFTKEEKQADCTILEGNFKTPLEFHLPGLVPCASQQAYFQMLIPNKWTTEKYKPMCIHLAGTGDHYFWRRRNFIVKPLLKEANIGGIILENPFYGVRKPGDQVRSNLHNVSDIFVMGGCLVLECLVLLHWCERMGYGPLGVTGLSMGGHMASLAATNWPKPLVLVPCLSWSTAATVFTTGVMSQSINWDMLETQYFSDGQYSERLSKMVAVIDDAFAAGQKFVKNFNQSMCELKEDIKDVNVVQSEVHLNGNTTKSTNKIEKYPIKTDLNVKHIVKIDNKNTIGLSKNLHSKFMSKSKFELSQSEVNELNLKIRNIKEKDPKLAPKEETREDIRNQSTLTKLMEYILPRTTNQNEKIDITKTNWWEREALQFMRGMMDECTHLKNFSVPFDTSLIIAVCAKDDAYVPREGCSSLEEIWPGVEVRYLDAGHVSAYVLHQKLFRSSIMEAFERAKHKLEKFGSQTSSDQDLKSTITYEDLRKQYKKTTIS